MLKEIEKWNLERQAEQEPAVYLGIGIHTGNVVAGNMGAENRLNYTVLGANVNLAARICSKARGMQILVSAKTLEEEGVKERIEYEAIEPMALKGFSHSIPLFVVKGVKKEETPSKD